MQSGPVDLVIEDASFDPPAGALGPGGAADLRAPFNGKVIAVRVEAGAAVARGDPLLVIESMKLEHVLAAPRDAVIASVLAAPGQQAATGQVLLRFGAAA